ncbi:MAG: 4Fe-4S dicluster-binding protein [Candidatus Gastranaerophilaceae bacterium]
MYNFKVDEEKCIHCGLCVKDCSAKALEFNEDKIPEINEDACFKCQHCFAVCPGEQFQFLIKPRKIRMLLKNKIRKSF